MSRRSDGEKNVVKVSGYTRADGTYVAGYTRAAPQRKSRNKSSSCPGPNESYVSGYTRTDGNKVPGHFKAVPQKKSCSKSSTATSGYSSAASNGSCVNVYTLTNGTKIPGYTKVIPGTAGTKNSAYGIHVANAVSDHTTGKFTGSNNIRSKDSDISFPDSSVGVKCYVDNAYNRRLGRAGKPLRSCIVRSCSVTKSRRSQMHKKLLEESKLEDLVQAMKGMQTTFYSDSEYSDYQYAIDRLQRDEVEESWKENNVEPSKTNVTSLLYHYPGNQIPFTDLELEKVIGRGGFGEVYAGCLLGRPIAFKKLLCQQMSLKWKKDFSKEVTILTTTSHPNIIKMLGYVNEEDNVGIVMEYLRCSLYRAIFVDCTLQDVEKKKVIISQIACALNYLHTCDAGKIAHCDIKSENVLLDWSDNALLCDFGLSALKNTAMSTHSSIPGIVPPGQGTPCYSAPEVLRGELLTFKQLLQADIYSLAIVVFEVMTEEEPFEGLSIKQLETNVGHGNMRPTSTELSPSLEDLLSKCWDSDATKRLTAAEFQEQWNSILD